MDAIMMPSCGSAKEITNVDEADHIGKEHQHGQIGAQGKGDLISKLN
jgi:hypothetical protein